MNRFQPGDLVTISGRLSCVTIWADALSDDVVGHAFPGEFYLVLDINEKRESLRVVDTKRGVEGWVSQNIVDKVK